MRTSFLFELRWSRSMESRKIPTLLAVLAAVFATALPKDADALFRAGVDARWIPLAVETMDESAMSLGAGRQLESMGVGARFLLGFDYFSIGPKLNFARHVFEDPDQSFSQLDANAHVRIRIPTARLAVFAEGGPAISLDIGGVGYNAALGVEVDVLGWPLVDMNMGFAVQYANVPIGTGPTTAIEHESVRAMVVVGFDFTLQGLGN